MAGLHRTAISMVEWGIKTPTVVTLVGLVGALGMGTAELMGLLDCGLAATTRRTGTSVADGDVAIASDEGVVRGPGRQFPNQR